MTANISVREITIEDIPFINQYWADATPEYLLGMGADPALLPDQKVFKEMLQGQLSLPYAEKQSYCIIWLIDDEPVGHCNVNKIVFGQEAYMHLHLWHDTKRQSGLGAAFVKWSLPYFFKNLQLKTLFCEPYALNPAPNKTLQQLGFEFIKAYITIPGSFSFEQLTARWELSLEKFKSMH
jgi:RimJ/RimL family protein N-acetyltransferase